MKRLYRLIILITTATSLLSCAGRSSDKVQEEQDEEHHEGMVGNLVSLTAAQIQTADIRTDTIEMKNLTNSISVNGVLAVPNQNKALVTSMSPGILTGLAVQPGDPVKKGQVIGTIANAGLAEMQQQYSSVQAQATYAGKEVQRLKELVAQNAAPLKMLQKAEAEHQALRAQATGLEQQLTAMGASASGKISSQLAIKAPINGTISEVHGQIGSRIDADMPIAGIINNSELHLDLFVYEKDLPLVKKDQRIHFSLTHNPGKEYDAQIYSIGTAFANETRAVPVHAHVINEKTGLIEGMAVTARISLDTSTHPAVPDAAVISLDGGDFIFVETSKKDDHEAASDAEHITTYERIQVIKGVSDVGYSEIRPLTPIPGGSHVVTKGAFFLMAKMVNTGHEH